jgi:hypothetical protein
MNQWERSLRNPILKRTIKNDSYTLLFSSALVGSEDPCFFLKTNIKIFFLKYRVAGGNSFKSLLSRSG